LSKGKKVETPILDLLEKLCDRALHLGFRLARELSAEAKGLVRELLEEGEAEE